LRDPVVGQALGALHGATSEQWTVERLARLVGLSRSVFAARFTEMVGQPPMQYLVLWRMQLASRLLIEGSQVAAVAGAVGYESEAAFSRAFKKLVGQPRRRGGEARRFPNSGQWRVLSSSRAHEISIGRPAPEVLGSTEDRRAVQRLQQQDGLASRLHPGQAGANG
jgi:AraC-like DNA-binding protein